MFKSSQTPVSRDNYDASSEQPPEQTALGRAYAKKFRTMHVQQDLMLLCTSWTLQPHAYVNNICKPKVSWDSTASVGGIKKFDHVSPAYKELK